MRVYIHLWVCIFLVQLSIIFTSTTFVFTTFVYLLLKKSTYTNELCRCYRNLEILYYIKYNMSKGGAILRYHVCLFLTERAISKPTNTNLDGCLEVCIKTLNFSKILSGIPIFNDSILKYSIFFA